MKKRFSDRTIKSLFEPKKKKSVTRDDFKLVRSDSHMVQEAVPGYTVEYEGVHFIKESALVRFPSLFIAECSHCRRLRERTERNEKVKLTDTSYHC